MSLLAVDLGSSGCRAAVFNNSGDLLSIATAEYGQAAISGDRAEMAPQQFWAAFRDAVRGTAAPASDPVEALSFSSQGETFVPVDGRNEPLAPAILNIDNRAGAEARQLETLVGRKEVFEITGAVAHPMYTIPKIGWLAKHEPELFGRTVRFATIVDWIQVRLGCLPSIGYSLASRYLGFDIRRKVWSAELLEAVGIGPERLPQPAPSGIVIGSLSAEAAHELGLPGGVFVVNGGHDQPCAALGMGVSRPGMASASIGTYECLLVSSPAPSLDREALAGSLNSYCHVIPDQYVTIAYFPSGIMLKWFCDLVYANRAVPYEELEASAPLGPTGILVSPNLIGSCNPDFDAGATGAITGLRASTNPAAIYKGILEGLACEMARMTELLGAATGGVTTIRVGGGGARSPLGLQLRAAFSGCRLERTKMQEASCLGAAILAGVGAHAFSDYNQAVSRLVSTLETIEPDAVLAAEYEDQISRWRVFCNSLTEDRKNLGRRLKEIAQ